VSIDSWPLESIFAQTVALVHLNLRAPKASGPPVWVAVIQVVKLPSSRWIALGGISSVLPVMDWTETYGLGADPYDSRDILAGAAYIRELHDRYGTPGFLAVYNAGPRRHEDQLATVRPVPDETKSYVAALASMVESK
jgi:hypothetical protein